MGYLYEYMHVSLVQNRKDLVVVRDLATQIWHDHYIDIIGVEQVVYMLEKMYDIESLQQQLAGGDIFYLLQDGDLALGFASINERLDKSWFLNKLYVLTSNQRLGSGSFLLNYLISLHKIETLRLQVNRQNFKAINFYFKMGFVIEKVADFDIGDGYFMNDFVMVWNAEKR